MLILCVDSFWSFNHKIGMGSSVLWSLVWLEDRFKLLNNFDALLVCKAFRSFCFGNIREFFYFCSCDDPANLQNCEVCTCTKQGLTVVTDVSGGA